MCAWTQWSRLSRIYKGYWWELNSFCEKNACAEGVGQGVGHYWVWILALSYEILSISFNESQFIIQNASWGSYRNRMVNVWQVFGTIPITDLMFSKNLLLSLVPPLLVQARNLLHHPLSSFPWSRVLVWLLLLSGGKARAEPTWWSWIRGSDSRSPGLHWIREEKWVPLDPSQKYLETNNSGEIQRQEVKKDVIEQQTSPLDLSGPAPSDTSSGCLGQVIWAPRCPKGDPEGQVWLRVSM